MKTTILLPAITGLVGFCIAWIAKPNASPPNATSETKIEELSNKRSPRHEPSQRPTRIETQPSSEISAAGDFPLADLADQGPKTRSEAKMLRLTEALGLSIDQQGAIISLIEGIQTKINPDIPIIEDLAIRGSEVEEALKKLLTPEQFAKFEDLRIRERENRIEIRSQNQLTQIIQDIDLAANQREEVLERLRQKSKADFQAIPAAAALLFDQSMLPTQGKELSVEGLLQSAKFAEHNPDDDPGQAFQRSQNRRKSELEALLRCFDGILTPGQMGQYHASVAEKAQVIEQAHRAIISKPPK